MILALLGLAFADTPVEEAIQAIRTAEWKRQTPAQVVAASDLDDPAVLRVRAQALGRLRDPGALKPLLALKDHPDAGVRREVAFALGLTPGAAKAIRAWLAAEPMPEQPLLAEHSVRWELLEALGRAGEAGDVALLVKHLGEPWPFDDAAARSLLRMQRREIDVRSARSPLIRKVLAGADPRTERTIAGLIGRVGLEGIADPALLDGVADRALLGPTSAVRAGWTRALVRADSDRGRQAFDRALSDSPLVAATALQFAAEGVADEARVAKALSGRADDWWVWSAAVAAFPSIEAPAEGPFREAWVIEHGGDVEIAPDEPWPVQAARLGRVENVDALLAVVTGEGHHPALRTAAASRIHDLGVDAKTHAKLLSSPDVGVREAALGWLEGDPDPAVVEEIVLTLRVEKDGEVMRAGFDRLADYRKRKPSSVSASRFLTSALKRGATHRSPGVQASARALAAALGVEVPPPPESALVRELILPDGTVTTTTGDLPKLLEVEQIAAARIQTDKGTLFVELHPEVAPLAVYNFAALARGGFYRGVLWHRVVPGFVVQAGCPRGDGWGGPGWTIVDEVSDAPFVTGALGMARSDRDTGGSQFFVMTGPGRFLDGDYTWFGEVVDSAEVLRVLEPGDRIQGIQILARAEPTDE